MRRTVAFFALAIALGLLAQAPAFGLPDGVPHLPDLVTVAPSSVRLVTTKGSPIRRLFFANTIGNIGDGPLELRAENNATLGTTDAIQEIYTHGSTAGKGPQPPPQQMILVSSSLVGTFVFHPAHNHWHMADFARYELRAINPDGSTGPVVAVTDKYSFCMIDTGVIDASLTHYNMGLTHACGQSARQGIRVGRSDTYAATLPDQYIDITTVPNGTYRLVSVADPNSAEHASGQLIERNDANNAAWVDVVITRTSVTIVPGSQQTQVDAP
jgi:hypothetical protein